MGSDLNSFILLDTGIWAQTLVGKNGLSRGAQLVIGSAQAVFVSPISVYEIGQKCRLGKWDEMRPFVDRLPDLLRQQGAQWAPLSADILLESAVMDWVHRDPFDRMIATTAKKLRLHVVTTDNEISTYLGADWVTN